MELKMFVLIKEGICSKYELDNCYTLTDFLKLYSLWKMSKDIEAAKYREMETERERRG